MKTEKRKLDLDNVYGNDGWCTICALCPLPPEMWVFVAVWAGYE